MKKIAVGICSYKNPAGLQRALASLIAQQYSAEQLELSIYVVDNDGTGANREVVDTLQAKSRLPIILHQEPRQGLSYARNKMIEIILADELDAFLFMDDDEAAVPEWVAVMVDTWQRYDGQIVCGPVRGECSTHAKGWLTKTTAFDKDRPEFQTGDKVRVAYTDNTLVDIKVLQALGPTFHPALNFSGGEDLHYFLRAKFMKFKAVWCREAVLYETIPDAEVRLSRVLRRYYRYGKSSGRVYLLLEKTVRMYLLCVSLAGYNLSRSLTHLVMSAACLNANTLTESIRYLGLSLGYFRVLLGGKAHNHYQTYR